MKLSTKIHESFESFAHLHPSHPAIFTDEGTLTYAQLNSVADLLALELYKRDIGVQEAVGVLTDRSGDLPAAFLAILKAGGVYVPMVADLPAKRLVNIAKQAEIKIIIALDGVELPASLVEAVTENGSGSRTCDLSAIIRLEQVSKDTKERESFLLPEKKLGKMTDLAAILFTSGSTGIPKGVMLQHDACANMALGHIEAHGIGSDDRILLSTSPGFILGFRELCLPFMCGATFVPVSRSIINNPDQLIKKMECYHVSLAMFTPSYLRLLKGVVPQGLRCIITAGERPNAVDARHYAQYLDYWNVHGATEVCGTICMYHVDPDGQGGIPSGSPFANTSVYLLDENGDEVKNGEIGEIHIVSVGVSRGYLNQPELSDKTFVNTRYGRAYRSHDFARWNTSGELETLGRADDVIKISGQSVALGEIESALQNHPNARRATAMQHRGLLIGCVECPDSGKGHEIDWRKFLSNTLPSYMIPAQIIELTGMPISSAGKLDRKSLLKTIDSTLDNERRQKTVTAPKGKLELTIAGVWEKVINLSQISREDNFFALGGTSLMAIEVSSRLYQLGFDVPVQMVLTELTIRKLAAHIFAMQQEQDGLNGSPAYENIATADQKSFWLASKIGMVPAASHIGRVFTIGGAVPHDNRWQLAWTRLLDHHAALRTQFYSKDTNNTLCWRTSEPQALSLHKNLIFDSCSSLVEAQKISEHWRNKDFNLSEAPLARAGLIKVADENLTFFWFVFHHSVVDGISARLIQDDMLALLGDRQLPPVPNGIDKASRAEQRYLASERVAHDRKFWLNRLDTLIQRGDDVFDDQIMDYQRPVLPSGRGGAPLIEHLNADIVQKLGHVAKRYGTGLHGLLLAILTAETRRRTGLQDVIIGSGISLRPAGCETAVGHFVNLLPIILMQDRKGPFSADLGAAQSSLTASMKHSAYPASLLYREFRHQHPQLRPSRTSLFDIALTAVPSHHSADTETGLTLDPQTLPGELVHPAAGLDLLFSHEPCPETTNGSGGINLHLSWNPDVCSKKSAKAWLSSFSAWARWLAEKPERFEQPLPSLLPHETQLLEQWETGPCQPLKNQCCHELFEAFAHQDPLRSAVVSGEKIETYGQLNIRADKIAHTLRYHGIARGKKVAVLTIGSSDLPATILGIWKAGGIYLPLAHELPAVRLTAISKDADAELLVVLDELEVPKALAQSIATTIRFEDCFTVDQDFDSNFHKCLHANDPGLNEIAYIIYTSGTTGMPKGVPVTHKGYINCILGIAERVGLLPDDRMSQAATVGFDASLFELGMALFNGITLVPVSYMLREDPWQLKRYYHELGVTIAFHTPSYLRISEQVPFKNLRILFTGGEAPSHRDVDFHASQLAFWNCYGPTETAIIVSLTQLINKPGPAASLSVGRPLPNVRISLRREDGSLVPPGVQGELWIGGDGVAHNYLNRPELSAECFVNLSEGRYYRSGDYGHWNADGSIVINGRMDHQVKLNGQRVELGEIEQMLCTHSDVADAIVLVEDLDSGMKVLRAFILPNDQRSDNLTPSETILTDFLVERLPTHMLPASITTITERPLTPVGKVDRIALLEFFHVKQRIKTVSGKALQGRFEKSIAAIWSNVLGVPVTRNDNFFALGGDSLLAVTLAHQISEKLNQHISARSLFASPTLVTFINSIKSQQDQDKPLKINRKTDHASEGEVEFWIAETAGLDIRTFTIPIHRTVIGDVDHDSWQSAWSTLVARHEGLRTFFKEDEKGQLVRKITSRVTESLVFTTMPCKTDALAHIRSCQREALPMTSAPLFRAGLVEIKNVESKEQENSIFWLALHHSVGDGQSINTLLNELTILLGHAPLPPTDASPRVLAAREQSYLTSKDAVCDAEYWNAMLKKVPDTAFKEWPLDTARSHLTPPGNHRLEIRFDSQTSQRLKGLARDHNSTLHSVMLTLFAMEIRRRTGRCDILVGTTASIREKASDAQIVGYGVNMLPLHLVSSEQKPFSDLLSQTQDALAKALQHARYPFSRICREFWNERPGFRNPQRYPLFDIAITENPGRGQLRTKKTDIPQRFIQTSKAAKIVGYERTKVSPGQDIVLIHESLDNGEILLKLHINAAVYTKETSQNWIESLAGWVRWITKEKSRADYPLPRLLPEEQALLSKIEYGKSIARPKLRFHELFETMVDRQEQTDLPAVITHDETISYKDLDQKANAIAHALVTRGVRCGDVVAVLSGRSLQLPAAALGIWKAGAVYLPLAFDLPPERLAFIVCDAGASHLMALDGVSIPQLLAHGLPEALRPEELSEKFYREYRKRLIIKRKAPTSDKLDNVAYILYTSGSTGKPKGTLIGHDSYVNLVLSAVETYGLSNSDRCLMFASPSFDVSLSDIGVPLACGAAICPVPYKTIESPNRFLKFLQEMSITLADITPTYLRLFEGEELPDTLRILVTGGEPPVIEDVQKYAAQLAYYNAYGPTENTITSCMERLKSDQHGPICAGRPLPNTSLHVCDSYGEPIAFGVVGEIWLGGAGLGIGYLNRPEQMQKAFVSTSQGRRYRTGDLGRWTKNKTVEIAGRIDDQVKLNGIRIELGEIEYALAGHGAVSQAVTLLVEQDDGKRSLRAFVRLSTGEKNPTANQWRGYLSQKLPSHMIPSDVIEVSEIPLSTSGKVDKSALHGLLPQSPSLVALTLPQNDLERKVAEAWATVLKINPIHREDNFFELGGHSLLAIEVAYRLEKNLGCEVPARELFIEPTLTGFTERLRVNSFKRSITDPVSNRATIGQQEFWTAEQAGFDTCGFNIPLTLAVQGEVPSSACWLGAWDKLLLRHDALRTSFVQDESGVLRREVSKQFEVKFKIEMASSLAQAKASIKAQQLAPFSMGTPGLWRAGLIKITDNGQSIFWFVIHHAVADGLSLGILIEELLALLQNNFLSPPVNNFDRTAGIEKDYLAGKSSQADAGYWQNCLGSLAKNSTNAFDEWPLDKPRPHVKNSSSIKGSHCFSTQLDPAVSKELRTLAQKNGATLHALMLTVVGLEVQRRTGRPEFLLGTAASTRTSAAEAQVIGYFVNMLPLVFRSKDDRSIHSAVRAMQQELAQALQHSRYPFARIYDDFRQQHSLPWHPVRYPLFDIAVTENPPTSVNPQKTGLHFTGLDSYRVGEPTFKTTNYELRRNAPAQDIVLVHEEQSSKGLALTWYVNAAIYTKETAQAWFDSLIGWLEFFGEQRQTKQTRLPRLLPVEERLLDNWQKGPIMPLSVASFPDLFRQIAEKHPQNPAIVTDAGVLSFTQINAGSDALANALVKQNLKRGDAVGVYTERSTTLPETVLAIWKAGGCYLPLTPELPVERLLFMAKDAGIKILIVLDGLLLPTELDKKDCIIIRPEKPSKAISPDSITQKNTNVKKHIYPDDPAYIIYTSGSTGMPKGVVLNHKGMLNLGLGGAKGLGITSYDRTLLMASPSFDLWISDLVMAWAAGAALVPVLREEMNDISGVRAMFKRLSVTVATMSPSYLRLFEQADLHDVRILMTVGEPPVVDDVEYYSTRLSYFNGYGPTENTAAASLGRIPNDGVKKPIQITAGRPISNSEVYIVNENGNRLPPGDTGEVWLSGIGLAEGYLNRPDLTKRAFVTTNGKRRYRTGDLGRWLPNGELEILGRLDSQVKLRGQRVELEEIEHCLSSYPGVLRSVVIAKRLPDNTQVLWAFFTMDQDLTEPTTADFGIFMSTRLPSYMIPSAILQVDSIPLTAAGKVNSRELLLAMDENISLVSPMTSGGQIHSPRTPPQNDIEKRIASVWAERIGCPTVACEDNFFELGGDSLRAIAVVGQLDREFKCKVNDLYENPVLADFAAVCQPRPDHLGTIVDAFCAGYQEHCGVHSTSWLNTDDKADTEDGLRSQRNLYDNRIRSDLKGDLSIRQNYRHVLLTGATGYLGSYLLRELMADPAIKVTVVVRGNNNQSACARVGQVLSYYFGTVVGKALCDDKRLTVLAGDLRSAQLLLHPRTLSKLTASVDAIFHCAANVNHIGHYGDFLADNVTATRHLLDLAALRKPEPADFHFVSTLSVSGRQLTRECQLFTEYDTAPKEPDDNYYIRTKQEAEHLVISARNALANTCIHRIGNITFASDSDILQQNIEQNAFFRQLVSFIQLGAVPMELPASLSHVDIVASGVIALAGTKTLINKTHHVETPRQDRLADFICSGDAMAERVMVYEFGAFLERLKKAIDEPAMESAVTETVETFGLQSGHSIFTQGQRLSVVSDGTHALLNKLGILWPEIPLAGQNAMLKKAMAISKILVDQSVRPGQVHIERRNK
jgi:amino acid adenylation domain-containing protein/thioester reductase-like protein